MDKLTHWSAFCILLVLLSFVQYNATQESICKVFCGPKSTKYVVYTKLHPDEYDCLYSWSNYTDFVLANAHGQVNLVRTHTNTTLEIFERMNVNYELNCMSRSTLETHHGTTCVADCSDISQSPIISSSGHYSTAITISVIIVMSVLFVFNW